MLQRTTQRDIARAAGVDVSTVSLALHAHPRIPAATRTRIQSLAAEMGYRSDPALSSIAASRWQGRRSEKGIVLGILSDSLSSAEPELKLYHKGILRQAGELGYGVDTLSLPEYRTAQAFWRVVQARGLRGVIIGQTRSPLQSEFFSEAVAPTVHCGFLREISGDTVRPDLGFAVENLLSRIAESHRRIACFLPVERTLQSDRAILGAALAAAKMHPAGRLRTFVMPQTPRSADWQALARAKVDAVVVISEKQARQLRAQSVLADEIPIFTLHTLPPFEGKRGMDLRMEEVGRVAVNFLEMKMRRLPLSTAAFRQTVLIEPRWIG
jgi:DNA-binding LacI/PurR family transcriptional regulator